jgi:hypothetical protein
LSNKEIEFRDFKVVARKDRLDTRLGRGGGVAILAKSDLSCVEVDIPICCVGLQYCKLACVYNSPSSSGVDCDALNAFLGSINKDIVIMGDFNHPLIDWATQSGQVLLI